MAIEFDDIPFFQSLSKEERSAVKRCLREKSFGKAQSIFIEGSECKRVFFVKSGRVKLFRVGSNGREQILETLSAGDTCACNTGIGQWNCSSGAEALTPCTVWFLSKDHYADLVKNNINLAHSLNLLFSDRLRCFSALIEEISLKDSKKRVVKFLLDRQGECGNGSVLSLPFTREELAQRIGMTRETVTRQLQDLKRRKFIDISRRNILIRDRDGLKKLL